ncbi:hypothetical protein AAHC03_022826 [Spirometra sp. Aus1]
MRPSTTDFSILHILRENEEGSSASGKSSVDAILPTQTTATETASFGDISHLLWTCCEASTSSAGSPLDQRSSFSTEGENSPYSRCRRRHQYQRVKANARERMRVHTIAAAFETLRRSVPTAGSSTRLSKLAVLRIAASYIETLAACLEANPPSESDLPEDLSLKGPSAQSQTLPDPLLRFDACIRKLNRIVRAESRSRR